ncbi:MAG: TetR/AcrR family transcriptional regulator [Candidatus Hydrogenedentota bacterium]
MTAAKQAWLDTGLALLEEQGPGGLTIDELTRRLGRTKGSYYHHFKSRDGFVDALLRHWEEENTQRIIREAEAAGEAEAKKRLLTQLTQPLHESRIEVHIRAWALTESRVRAYVARVDEARMGYVRRIAEVATGDRDRAQAIARIVYAVFVGAQQVLPPIKGKELVRLYADLERLYEL